jgi:hypothetical protein
MDFEANATAGASTPAIPLKQLLPLLILPLFPAELPYISEIILGASDFSRYLMTLICRGLLDILLTLPDSCQTTVQR